MRCKLDGKLLQHMEQDGFADRWRCRGCGVVWELAPRADEATNPDAVATLQHEAYRQFQRRKGYEVQP